MDLIPGEEIEQRSLTIIEKEAGGHGLNSSQWPIARRMVHASADFSILPLIKFNADPVAKGIAAFKRGAPIITDSTMLKSGISRARLGQINPVYQNGNIFCSIADKEVSRLAKTHQLPRSVFNIRSLKDKVDKGVVCIGNAPTALWEIIRLIKEENIVPALLFAMPVGFVNVVETKAMIKQMDVPFILMEGRRGGTTFVVAALNAIAILALEE